MSQRFLVRQTLLRYHYHQQQAIAIGTTRRSIGVGTQWRTSLSTSPCNSTKSLSSYAMVQHGDEYSQAMEGRHGKQLDLAWKEGSMKHDRSQPFDPFAHYRVNEDDHAGDDDEEGIDIDEGIDEDIAMSENEVEQSSHDNNDTDESPTATLDAITKVKFNKDGSLQMPHTTRAAHVAGAPAGGAFAIISLGNSGIQHKVTKHDVIISNKLKPVETWAVGTTHTIGEGEGGDDDSAGQVLLVGDSDRTCVGLPFVQGAQVDVMVEEITRDQTVIVFKKKRRKNHRRKNGSRREVTFLRVLDIRFPNANQDKEDDEGTLVEDMIA